jgi:hypothetical protein
MLFESYSECRYMMMCERCGGVLMSDIYICINSHPHCADCIVDTQAIHNSIPLCKKCNKEIFNRSHSIESLRDAMLFPCKWEECSERYRIMEIDSHERVCRFKQIHCSACKGVTYYPQDTIHLHMKAQHNITFKQILPQDHLEIIQKLAVTSLRQKSYLIGLSYQNCYFVISLRYNTFLKKIYIGCQTLDASTRCIQLALGGQLVSKNIYGGQLAIFFTEKTAELPDELFLEFSVFN